MNLLSVMTTNRSMDDLKYIVSALDMEWENISGDTLSAKVRNIINDCHRQNMTCDLLNILSKKYKVCLQEYLYIIIEEICRDRSSVERVYSQLGIVKPNLFGYNADLHFRMTTVKALQVEIETNNLQNKLFNALLDIWPYYSMSKFDWYYYSPITNPNPTEDVLFWN